MSAAHHGLGRLTAIVDFNQLQSDASHREVMCLDPLPDKWRAFGWDVFEIDGHSQASIAEALDAAEHDVTRPAVIIGHTVKGKGVSFMEGVPTWHGSVKMTEEQVRSAWTELGIAANEQDQMIAGRF